MNSPVGREEILFDAARRLPDAPSRQAFFEAACGPDMELRRRLEALFAGHDAAEAFFGRPPPAAASSAASTGAGPPGPNAPSPVPPGFHSLPGAMIGRYKLLQTLGEGGFGQVWMAEQREPVKRRVALKILKPGMDSRQVVARFEAERQALALMDHPNIARVFDGGTTGERAEAGSQMLEVKAQEPGSRPLNSDSCLPASGSGRPYFVMELVRGTRITDYCDENQLPPVKRLELFIQVCQAVQHAHQKGVIHRDLKPSNILVTLHDGVAVPKVIDFGIAKATQGELTDKTIFTEFKQLIGTPAYMSPEQAEMSGLDIDTRSDIYSLGVLLYELLTGRTPFANRDLVAAGVDAMRRTIREQEPPRPSQSMSTMTDAERTTAARCRGSEPPALVHLLRGDLDWIVMKCLEKDRQRRYESAGSLAAEIRNFLAQEPVTARPPSTGYRLRKLVHRNKLAFIAATSVAVALLLGIVLSTWQAQRAGRAERKSQQLARSEAGQRKVAEQTAADLRRNLYATDIQLAQREIEAGDVGAARLRLDHHRPAPGQEDVRGFEWRYLRSRTQGDDDRILARADGSLWQLALSPDGTLLAGGRKVWSVQTGDVVQQFPDGESAAAFAPHPGGILFVNSKAGFKRRRIGTAEEWLMAPGEGIVAVAFSRSGRWMATGRFLDRGDGSYTGNLGLWEAGDWRRVATVTNLLFDPRISQALAFAPDEKWLLAATGHSLASDGRLLAFEVPSLKPAPFPDNPLRDVSAVEFAPDAHEIYTATWTGHVQVWDAISRTEMLARRQRGRHRSWINTLRLLPGTRTLLTSGADRCIRLWDTEGKRPDRVLRGHADEISASALSADGATLFTACRDTTLRVWSPARATPSTLVPTPLEGHYLLGVSSNGTRLASLQGERVSVRDLREPHTELPFPAPNQPGITGLGPHAGFGFGMAAISPDFRWLAVTHAGGTVELRDLAGGHRRTLAERVPERAELVFSHDSRHLAFARRGGSGPAMVLFDLPSQREVAELSNRSDWDGVSLPQFVGRSSVLMVPTNGTFVFWDGTQDTTIRTLPFRQGNLSLGLLISFALSSDGRQFATGYTDNAFLLRRAADGALQAGPVTAHVSGLEQLAFSPDGRTLATASQRWLKLWNSATLREVAVFELPDKIGSLRFTPDGHALLASTASDIFIWHAPSLEEFGHLSKPGQSGTAGERSNAASPQP